MIKLHASLIALTLATGSALASSSGFDSNNKDLYMRGDQELFKRQPMRRFVFGYAMGNHHWHHHSKLPYYYQLQEFEDEQELFGRDLDAEELVGRDDTLDNLEAREPVVTGMARGLVRTGSHRGHSGRMGGNLRLGLGLGRHGRLGGSLGGMGGRRGRHSGAPGGMGRHRASGAFEMGMNQMNAQGQNSGQNDVQSREFEDDQELFGRDFDDQELFGREYDIMDERDLSDDLQVREPSVGGAIMAGFDAAYKHRHHLSAVAKAINAFSTREFEDEELFERDLDGEELFEREYDLLDDLD